MLGLGKVSMKRWVQIFGALGMLGVIGLFVLVWCASEGAKRAGEGRLFDDVESVPEADVGLVLGCSRFAGGVENLYFLRRVEAAEKLWKAGKVKCFIVSGDNHAEGYNEPKDLKNELVKRGVPENKIVCDFAGFRTLDSIVRAKEVFGVENVVVVSQKFHNERAAYLADSVGLQMVGFNAAEVVGISGDGTAKREKLARVKMWLDVHVLRTKPKFLGEKEELPP